MALLSTPGRSLAAHPWRDRLVALLLFVVCGVIYHRAPVIQLYDWRLSTAVSHALLHEGKLSLDPSLHDRVRRRHVEVVGEKAYHWYPNAVAALNVPALYLFEKLGVTVFDEQGRFSAGAELRVLRFSAAVVTAMTVAVSFLIARQFVGIGWALGMSLVLAFGTSLFSTASRPYWSHGWAVLFLTLALYGLLASASRRGWLRWVLVATAVAWAVFCRPNMFISALALTILLTARRRRGQLLVFVSVGAVWLALFVLYSEAIYDQLLPSYFFSSHVETDRISLGRLLSFHPEGALGTLLSPARGLMTFTPILLTILVGVAWHWRRLSSRSLAVVGLAAIMVHWHLVSSVRNWPGGAGFGPRLFTDLLPWFFVLGAMALAAVLERRPAERSTFLAWGRWAVLALLAVLSVGIHTRGAVAKATKSHWGLWNWSYPQFAAGLYANPDLPLPGMRLNYDASADVDPRNGWPNLRRKGLDFELHESVTHRKVTAAGVGIRSALRFNGEGGGWTRSLAELGGKPNVTLRDASLEIWIRPEKPAAGRQVLFETGGRETGLTLYLEDGEARFEARDGGHSASTTVAVPGKLSFEEFSQIVATLAMESEGTRLRLFVNGELRAGPVTAEAVTRWAGGNPSGLGTDDHLPSVAAGDFRGEIAILRFYESALSPGQVAHNFRALARRR